MAEEQRGRDPIGKKKLPLRRTIAIVMAVAGALLVAAGLWFLRAPTAPPASSGNAATVTSTVQLDPDPYAENVGQLLITQERKDYQTGDLVLKIPRLGVDSPVQDGTTGRHLAKGPGLYRYSQLPGNTPASIAITAHRDIGGKEFYYIDRLGPGDLFYLVYKSKIYTYLYRETTVVDAGDWKPIAHQAGAQLSIISCTPLGTSLQRMVVISDLVAIDEETPGFDFGFDIAPASAT